MLLHLIARVSSRRDREFFAFGKVVGFWGIGHLHNFDLVDRRLRFVLDSGSDLVDWRHCVRVRGVFDWRLVLALGIGCIVFWISIMELWFILFFVLIFLLIDIIITFILKNILWILAYKILLYFFEYKLFFLL
jgi:hypothetical protein